MSNTRKTIYAACKYAPLELLAGLGFDARLLDDSAIFAEDVSAAEALTHPSLCAYGKGWLAYIMSHPYDAFLLTSCCDVMGRISDALLAEETTRRAWLLNIPHKQTTASADYLAGDLVALARELEEAFACAFDLSRALAAWEKTANAADDALLSWQQTPHLQVNGAHVPVAFMKRLDETSPLPVANTTCSGIRFLAHSPRTLQHAPNKGCGQCETEEASDLERFCAAYARALLNQRPCLRMEHIEAREELPLMAASIYHTLRFCDDYGFEYSELLHKNDDAPLLKIETDGGGSDFEQIATRIQAFFETIAPKEASRKESNMSAKYICGIDSGSTTTKAVILSKSGEIAGYALRKTGAHVEKSAHEVFEAACQSAGVTPSEVGDIIATGYGREAIAFATKTITEITCHARGAQALKPDVHCIVDIGGQDSKVIALEATQDDVSGVACFIMNDKCAAGTGRFLENMARVLEIDSNDFSKSGLDHTKELSISSMCTVFAESEVVSLVANNATIPDISWALAKSVASKTASLVKRAHGEGPFLFTGGVAQNESVRAALEEMLGVSMAVDSMSQYCGALGAALLG